jgi:hypothetical protein
MEGSRSFLASSSRHHFARQMTPQRRHAEAVALDPLERAGMTLQFTSKFLCFGQHC